MKTVKLNGHDAVIACDAFKQIARANRLESEARRLKKSGKKAIAEVLKHRRGIDVNALSIGDAVNVDTLGIIEVSGQNRLDQTSFQLSDPKTFAEYTREFPVVNYKPANN